MRTIFPLLALLMLPMLSRAAEPLHIRMDRIIDAKAQRDAVPLSGISDDAEFLRRVSLDLNGRIPTAKETRAFLVDASADKRIKLIDALLAKPEYAQQMANTMHIMLMERLGDHAEWSKFLIDAFAANQPWNKTVQQILRADHKQEATRGAGFFLSKRLENYGQNPVDYSALTRDVGRLLLGKNLQCAECHDHLFIDDYKQADFQGLHGFFKNTMLVDAKLPRVGEKPTLEKAKFASVFVHVEMETSPALPGGKMIEIPTFAKGKEYTLLPDRKTKEPGEPAFSTLAAVAKELPRAENRDFVRNAVNRFWFILLGRGIVHPLDLHHVKNPPSHPELLDLLAEEFIAHNFDVKYLLREIALTKTYQRSSVLPAKAEPALHAKYFATALEKRLHAETLAALIGSSTENIIPAAMRAKFNKAFANQPREAEDEIETSLKGVLFLLHDDSVLSLLKPKAGNLVDRVSQLSDAAIAEELYLAILTRKPSVEETAAVATILKKSGEKKTDAIGTIAWALLASMEWGVNH